MAKRRMFSLDVVDTDNFLDLPASSQALYFHLGMRADDDGFIASPKKITALVNCSQDDFKLLLAKGYIIPFESGICVVTDWNINNYIQKDRYHETIYLEEKKLIKTGKNGSYTACIQSGYKTYTQDRLDKDNIYIAHFSNEQEKELCQKEDGNTESESLASETVAGLSDELNHSMTIQDIPGKAESLAVKKAAGVSERLNRSMTIKNSRFDEFWQIYPRRVAKKEAQKAWKKIEPEKIPLILEAVERQKKGGALSREPQYIPHPATWLNRGQWEDEETAPKQKARKEFIITGHDELGNATGYWEKATC